MIYIDTSSLLKLIFVEEFSGDVLKKIATEEEVMVSGLTKLEVAVQIQARRRGGLYGDGGLEKARTVLAIVLKHPTFRLRNVSAALFEVALRQHEESNVHCRSLDRLHLAAMEEMCLRRLMTHDFRQAEAARELGIEVVMPGVR